ncbi:hypothetical protein BTA51_11215 [Hahella sp. CCB-MM4]|uniref:hypothetical protein n=1 Tax=Hahella sp. (strain CCB-MM4) TaxID=1926491 RepID=UPI000B9C145A|nr:hypothetical protein [Hahella sp. CCB-MM4]OZG73565.1 hypothetical protein BTA51_11215 [Hahella sp. CCB-MM4]
MNIDTSVGKKTTTLRWQYLGEKVSVRFPGRVEAEYSESKDIVVTVSTDGLIRLLRADGSLLSVFSYGNSEGCKFYVLTKSALTGLGVTIVMAHDPEHKGERFWQHEINVEDRTVSGPIDKWR